ncbi:MAG: ACT domain-containing protein [Patescibacteria group bacterium]
MSGETDLEKVLSSMEIDCDDVAYGLASTDNEIIHPETTLGTLIEAEGKTVIASMEYMQAHGLEAEGPFAKLTILVHTSLELVGLTAVLATKLAEIGVSANVFAGYYHDHIFVQYDRKDEAIKALLEFKKS